MELHFRLQLTDGLKYMFRGAAASFRTIAQSLVFCNSHCDTRAVMRTPCLFRERLKVGALIYSISFV